MRRRERTEVEADEVTMQTTSTCWWERAFAFVELTSSWVMGNTFLVRHLASLTLSRFHPQAIAGLSGNHPPTSSLLLVYEHRQSFLTTVLYLSLHVRRNSRRRVYQRTLLC